LTDVTNITPPRVPFLDKRTGFISREWYRFFLSLFNLTGGGTNVISIPDMAQSPDVQPDMSQESFMQSQLAAVASRVDAMDSGLGSAPNQVFVSHDDPLSYCAPAIEYRVSPRVAESITVGASAYSYVATQIGCVIVSGGTVSDIEFSIDGSSFYSVGQTAGMFSLVVGDTLRVTYTVAPTMTFIKR